MTISSSTSSLPASGFHKAWVVFSGKADVAWLRFLRPGFRHCYVLLHDGEQWLSVDPMLHHMDVQAYPHLSSDFDLPSWLRARDQIVIPAPVSRTRTKPAPWRPFTCVEAVKRILGLHRGTLWTPWQLYQHLTSKETLSWAV